MKPFQRFARHVILAFGLLVALGLSFPSVLTAVSVKTLEERYKRARIRYHSLKALPTTTSRDRAAWDECIGEFRKIIDKDTEKTCTDRCYYLIGQSYHYLFDTWRNFHDFESAVRYYEVVIREFPRSPLADDAQYLLGVLRTEPEPAQAYLDLRKVKVLFPNGDMASRAEEKAAELAKQLQYIPLESSADGAASLGDDAPREQGEPGEGDTGPKPGIHSEHTPELQVFDSAMEVESSDTTLDPAAVESPPDGASTPENGPALEGGSPAPTDVPVSHLERVQHWSNEDYTRVVVYLSGPAVFESHTLPADSQNELPARIYVDIGNCLVRNGMKHNIPIKDAFLQRVRVGQYTPSEVRVVLDTESMESYKIFSLADPFRVIIDIRGEKPAVPLVTIPPKEKIIDKSKSSPSLMQQLGLGVGCIVLDPGHGGKDKGAISPDGIFEKDIVLAIAKKLRKILAEKTGCEVKLTRTTDRYLTLEERTAFANTHKADLFISIHTNAHVDRSLRGTETYFLNFSQDKESARVAAVENATTAKRISDLEAILHDLMLNTKIDESSRLAAEVQHNLISELRKSYRDVRDLGVKQAPFYVLLGADMPGILVETAFLSNSVDKKRLQDRSFHDTLAKGITSGVESYMRQMGMVARTGVQP